MIVIFYILYLKCLSNRQKNVSKAQERYLGYRFESHEKSRWRHSMRLPMETSEAKWSLGPCKPVTAKGWAAAKEPTTVTTRGDKVSWEERFLVLHEWNSSYDWLQFTCTVKVIFDHIGKNQFLRYFIWKVLILQRKKHGY